MVSKRGISMYPPDKIREIIEEMWSFKEHLVIDHGETDMAPILVLGWTDGTRYQVDLSLAINQIIDAAKAREIDPPPTVWVLRGILNLLHDKRMLPPDVHAGGPPVPGPDAELDSVWICMESFAMNVASDQ